MDRLIVGRRHMDAVPAKREGCGRSVIGPRPFRKTVARSGNIPVLDHSEHFRGGFIVVMVKGINEFLKPAAVKFLRDHRQATVRWKGWIGSREDGMRDHRQVAICWKEWIEHKLAPHAAVGLLEFVTRGFPEVAPLALFTRLQ